MRLVVSAVLFVLTLGLQNCSVNKQLGEPCIEKGKIYRSLGSLKTNFVDIDKSYLPRLIHLSESLPDKWIRTGVESGDLEIWVTDYSTLQDGKYYFQLRTQHSHILYPTFPKKSRVKLPCTLMVSFDLDHPGGTRIYGNLDIAVKLRGSEFKQMSGYWEWNRITNRIEFTAEGNQEPTIYWAL